MMHRLRVPVLFRLVLLLGLVGLVGCASDRRGPAPLPGAAALDPDTVVVLLHGYISSADQFTDLQEPLQQGMDGKPPLHVHSFDYSAFSRVGFDHNLGVERLGEVLADTVHGLPDHCEICAGRAAALASGERETPPQVVFIARSFGGLILREALLGEAPVLPAGWELKGAMTLGTPFFGSELTRYSYGFLSVIINGGVRTALFGFVNPRRGGTFGNVIDAQVRARRLGSPYQVHAHERWKAHTDAGKAPPWAAVLSVGSRDPVNEGDRVVRFSAANAAELYPGWDVENLVIDVRHSRLFNAPPRRNEARELDRLLPLIRDWIDRPTLAGRADLVPRTPVPGGPAMYVFPESAAQSKLAHLARADRGDVWLRLWRGRPDDAVPLHPARDLGPFQVGEEWSRRWQELRTETRPTVDGQQVPTVLAAGPLSSHMVFLPDLTPSGRWSVEVELDDVWAEDARLVIGRDGDAIDVKPLRNNIFDVYLDVPATAALTDLRLVPEQGQDRR